MTELVAIPGIAPVDRQMTLFRYMSLAKFISLLQFQKLYLPSVQKLRQMDKHEGTVHQSVVDAIDAIPGFQDMSAQIKARISEGASPEERNLIEALSIGKLIQALGADQRLQFASCWHIAEHESLLMWNRYAPGTESVAIQTTVGNLLDSISGIERLRAGVVRYDHDHMAETYGTATECFYKYPIFMGENEFRILVYSDKSEEVGKGTLLEVNLQLLIGGVFVSPDAEDWFFALVSRMLAEYGVERDVQRTILKGN